MTAPTGGLWSLPAGIIEERAVADARELPRPFLRPEADQQ